MAKLFVILSYENYIWNSIELKWALLLDDAHCICLPDSGSVSCQIKQCVALYRMNIQLYGNV